MAAGAVVRLPTFFPNSSGIASSAMASHRLYLIADSAFNLGRTESNSFLVLAATA
jgi:hypothetical protein